MPIRVLVINYSSSGLFHYAACLVNALAEQPQTEVLFATSSYNPLARVMPHKNVRIFAQAAPHHLFPFFRWCLNFRAQWKFFQAVQNFRPDILHMTDSHGLYLLHAWWLRKYSIVFTWHDPVLHPGDVYHYPSRLIQWVQQHMSKHIVVHGETLKQNLVARGFHKEEMSIIPHGDYSFFQKWGKDFNKPLPRSILFFGRIVDYKGLDILLESLLLLQGQGEKTTLTIAGNGNLEPYQAALSRLSHINLINRTIPDEEVYHYFQLSEIVVLPYRAASQSGILAIALPAGRPIIATSVGAIADILQNEVNSLLVPPENPSALAEAIRRLLNNTSLKEKLVAGGQRTVTQKIAWPHVSSRYRKLYQELLHHPRFASAPAPHALYIVIPTYNEAPVIQGVITELQAAGYINIIVVDDGSTDTTGLIAEARGALVFRHKINRGKGAATMTGITAALQLGASIIVTMDGDGQHRAQDIAALIDPIVERTCEVVLGTRDWNQMHAPRQKVIINKIANAVTYAAYHIWVADSQSGLRAYSRYAASLIQPVADFYDFDSQVLREIRRHRLSFKEVPIHVRYTTYSQNKLAKQNVVNGLRTVYKMVWSLIS